MKKIIFIVLSLFFIPITIKAITPEIQSTWITGIDEYNTGETASLEFGIRFNGLYKSDSSGLGVISVGYELVFDDTVFVVSDIESSEWDSVVYKEDGKYYVISTISENSILSNRCADGISYCESYHAIVKFYIKDTNKTISDIKMGEVAVGLSPMIDPNKEYTEDDLVVLEGVSNKSISIKIKKVEVKQEQPSSIVSNKKPETNTQDILDKAKEEIKVPKSNNNYIKTLEIKGYKIDFRKAKKNYDLIIEKDVNKLELNIELENDKATYKILGNDNLKENDYKVLIEVTAENGDKQTYTINTEIKEDKELNEEKEETKVKEKNTEKLNIKIDKKYIIIGGIILGVIVLIIVIVKIIIYRKDRKFFKSLDEL